MTIGQILAMHGTAAQKASVVLKTKRLIEKAKHDPKLRAKLERTNKALVELALTPGKVHNDSTLSSVSIQYRNEEYIGLKLLPEITVGKASDKFFTYDKRNRLAAPDDSLETRSVPNEVSESRGTDNYSTKPYGLLDFVDQKTLENQDAPLNEMIDLVAAVNDALELLEEKRIATLLTTAGTYNAGQVQTLGAGTQWSDYTSATLDATNPFKAIEAARDSIWSPAQGATKVVGFCGLAVFRAMRRHPKVLEAFKHMQGLKLPTAQQLAEVFELDDLLVGRAWEDTANEGQTASYGRIWGKHFGIVRVAAQPSVRCAAFGWTFRFGAKVTNQWFDPKPGVAGGYYAKVGHQSDYKVAAKDTGALIQNAIA